MKFDSVAMLIMIALGLSFLGYSYIEHERKLSCQQELKELYLPALAVARACAGPMAIKPTAISNKG